VSKSRNSHQPLTNDDGTGGGLATVLVVDVLGQQLVDVSSHMRGLEALGIALEGLSIRANEELLKVPCNVRALDWLPYDKFWVAHQTGAVIGRKGEFSFKVFEHFVGTFAIGHNLVEHDALWLKSIARPDMLQGVHDFVAIGVFLMTKLVRWERKDGQLVTVLLAEFVHLREVTLCRAS